MSAFVLRSYCDFKMSAEEAFSQTVFNMLATAECYLELQR